MGTTEMAAADQDRAVGKLLERQPTASEDHYRFDEVRDRRSYHQHWRHDLQRHRLAELSGNTIRPSSGGIDDLRSLEAPIRGLDAPRIAVPSEALHRHALDEACTKGNGLAANGLRGAKGISSTIAARDDATGAMVGNGRNQAP